jgi:hypothetical protein
MFIQEEGTHHHFEALLYNSEPSLGKQRVPRTDSDWESFITKADYVGGRYDWTDISLGLHGNTKTEPSGAHPMERFLTISPANSPLPWQARNALADLKCEEGNMPDAHRRVIEYAYKNLETNDDELATDDEGRTPKDVISRLLFAQSRKRRCGVMVQRDQRLRKRAKTIVRTGPRPA